MPNSGASAADSTSSHGRLQAIQHKIRPCGTRNHAQCACHWLRSDNSATRSSQCRDRQESCCGRPIRSTYFHLAGSCLRWKRNLEFCEQGTMPWASVPKQVVLRMKSSVPFSISLVCPVCAHVVEAEASDWIHSIEACSNCGSVLMNADGILCFLPKTIGSKNTKDTEKEGWDRLGGEITEWESIPYIDNPFYRLAASQFDFVFRGLLDVSGLVGLDLGGGIGWLSYRLNALAARPVLADYNSSPTSGLARARKTFGSRFPLPAFQVDAEDLPFCDEQFDFVVTSSFLHHLPTPGKAIKEIVRVLKPQGHYVALCEAFCPWWMSKRSCIQGNEEVMRFIGAGVNEQVFYQREYIRWLKVAGFSVQFLNPDWDSVEDGTLSVSSRLKTPGREPISLRKRATKGSLLSKWALESGVWKTAVPWMRYQWFRRVILSSTEKHRIIFCRKPLM